MGQKLNLSGKRFGRLIVIKEVDRNKWGNVVWQCRCSCGEIIRVIASSLVASNTKSCGCLQIDWIRELGKRKFKHGDSQYNIKKRRNRLYNIWIGIKNRCLNSNNRAYKYYGGRGINIYQRWADNYLFFKSWALSHGYQDDLTIDRIDNDKGYYPENCQWIKLKENSSKARKEIKLLKR